MTLENSKEKATDEKPKQIRGEINQFVLKYRIGNTFWK